MRQLINVKDATILQKTKQKKPCKVDKHPLSNLSQIGKKKSSTNNDICFLKETMMCSSKKDENPSVSPFLMAMQ